jgi:hypothetical protein
MAEKASKLSRSRPAIFNIFAGRRNWFSAFLFGPGWRNLTDNAERE